MNITAYMKPEDQSEPFNSVYVLILLFTFKIQFKMRLGPPRDILVPWSFPACHVGERKNRKTTMWI
jgi:hypothetical protein